MPIQFVENTEQNIARPCSLVLVEDGNRHVKTIAKLLSVSITVHHKHTASLILTSIYKVGA